MHEEGSKPLATVTNQPAANTGEKENGSVLLLQDVDGDEFNYPDVDQVLKVTIKAK